MGTIHTGTFIKFICGRNVFILKQKLICNLKAEIPYYGCTWSLDFVAALDSGHRLGKPQFATSEMY